MANFPALTDTPAGFTGTPDEDGYLDLDGPVFRGDRFKVTTHWNAEQGYTFYIDRDNDDAFSLQQVQDLLHVLPGFLKDVGVIAAGKR